MTPTATTRPWVPAFALVLLLAVAGTACGIGTDESPRSLAADDVPYGLLDEAPATPVTTVPRVAQVNVAVYFVVDARLHPAPRVVGEPPTPGRAIAALMVGPSEDEVGGGLRTAINPMTTATVTRSTAGVVHVDLTTEFAAVPTPEQRLALGQIVFTATGVDGVTGVRFTVAGAPISVLLPDGSVTSDPVTREAFPSIAPAAAGPNEPA